MAEKQAVETGADKTLPALPPRRVLEPEHAALLSDMLSDDAARSAGFGRDSVLNLPFPVAAKTGTSKGYRDNWAVGYTREVTVAVWVGNFDGTPLRDASAVISAICRSTACGSPSARSATAQQLRLLSI